MSRLSKTHRIVLSGIGSLLTLCSVGCGPQFDPPSKLQSLRILAVKKDDPYVRPAPSAASSAAPDANAATPSVADTSAATPLAANSSYEPDATVHLTVALDDARPAAEHQGPLQKLLFGGCNNPPRDNYFSCLLSVWLSFKVWSELGPYSSRGPGKLPDGESWGGEQDRAELGELRFVQYFAGLFPDLAARALSGSSVDSEQMSLLWDQVEALRIGVGDTFDYTVPSWVFTRHPAPTDKDLPQYGLSQIFFVVCDGEIGISPGWEKVTDPFEILTDATRGFPLTCYERGTKKERGPDNFSASYSNVYVYEQLKNRNPVIQGFKFDGAEVTDSEALCIGKVCESLPSRVCTPDSQPRVKACRPNAPGGCNKHTISPILEQAANSEIDDNASLAGGGQSKKLREQMWIRYYADEGEVDRDAKRLQDATEGWFEDHETKWTAPEQVDSVAHIWSVAYDNRGGVDWVRLSVCIE